MMQQEKSDYRFTSIATSNAPIKPNKPLFSCSKDRAKMIWHTVCFLQNELNSIYLIVELTP